MQRSGGGAAALRYGGGGPPRQHALIPLLLQRGAVGEAGVAEAGADGEHAPARDVLHRRHLGEALHDGVVVHDHHGLVSADLRHGPAQLHRQVEPAALPVAGQVLAAALDRALLADEPGAADADEGCDPVLGPLGPPTRSLTMAARRPTASARDGGGSSSRWRQRSNFHTSGFERSGVFFWFVRTMPARMLVPPMSTPTRQSWPEKIQAGARWAAPMRPASSGWWPIGASSMSAPAAFSSTAARPTASSPMRLSRKPPPTAMRSVSRQPLRRRKRRITVASSWAKSSIAPWMTPAASGSPSTRS